jgi:hypothetical protein
MQKKLYLVRITRLVWAASDTEAQQLACAAANSGDVDCVRVIQDLYDLPAGWEQAIPYGVENTPARQLLFVQFASDPRFTGFKVQGRASVGRDEQGTDILEACDDRTAELWSVYALLGDGEPQCLGDFKSRRLAEGFRREILQVRNLWAQADEYYFASGTRPNLGEDAFLESQYEDRVSSGNYEDF